MTSLQINHVTIVAVMSDDDISDGAKVIFTLLHHTGEMSLDQLSTATSKSKPSMSRYCLELVKANYVSVTRAYHEGNMYRVNTRS